MANGKMYGLADVADGLRSRTRLSVLMDVVPAVYSMARLVVQLVKHKSFMHLHTWGDLLVYRRVFVEARVPFAPHETAGQGVAEFADQAVVWNAQVSKFQRKPDEMRETAWNVN